MNVLSREKQVQVIFALVEGCSIRSVERMYDVHRDTVIRLMTRTGQHCMTLLDDLIRDVPAATIQCDEVWTFVGKKNKRLNGYGGADLGSQYVFVAMDTDTKLVPCFRVGKRVWRVEGNPEKRHVSTSFVERQNLTMRMLMRRFTRLTNAFSKKVENQAHAVAIHFMFYNFVRIHKTLRVTPAMAAGVTDRLWELQEIVKLAD